MKSLLFSEVMMRAWLSGSKSVTRRLVNPQPDQTAAGIIYRDGKPINPKYKPGESIYIKETWCKTGAGCIIYKAENKVDQPYWKLLKWKSPRFMPEWAARSHAIVKSVRPERVRDITEEEAMREGCGFTGPGSSTALWNFQQVWESLHPGSLQKNEWVWRIELENEAPALYPVRCDCGYRGMRDSCKRGMCPNCGARVVGDEA